MVTTILQGGLGNMLFQIAAGVSLAIDNNKECFFDIDGHRIGLQGFNGSKYKNNIFRNIKNGKIDIKNNYQEPFFHYKKIEYKENIQLEGYFQSEKYFINNKEKIINLFSVDENNLVFLSKILDNIRDNTNKKISSIHIRRGDYLHFPNFHPFIGIDYINQSMKLFKDNLFLVFSDDIEWCKENIKNNFVYYIEEKLEDYQEMWLMSLCDNHIISNSSFSWWGSYLNKNENKQIIAPKIWFGNGLNHDTKDIYTDKMIKI